MWRLLPGLASGVCIHAVLSRRGPRALEDLTLGLMLCCHHPGILVFIYFNKGHCIFILHWAVENYIAVSRSWYRSFSCWASSLASFLLFYLFFLWLSYMHFVSCHIAIWWTGREQIYNRHWYFCEDLFPKTPSHIRLKVNNFYCLCCSRWYWVVYYWVSSCNFAMWTSLLLRLL